MSLLLESPLLVFLFPAPVLLEVFLLASFSSDLLLCIENLGDHGK